MKLKPLAMRASYGGAMIGWEEKAAIESVIASQGGRRWTIGEESEALEEELAKETGVAHAVLTNSGSSALLVAISALKLPKKTRVIIPALTFPTAYSSLLQAGLNPIVIDCDENLNIDLHQVEVALKLMPDIKAVVAIHIAGNVVDLRKLRKIVGKRRYIISDNCDGYGGTLDNQFIDTYADVSCISMHAAHIITMGEGGAVLTDNPKLASTARKMREWGRESGSDRLTNLPGFPSDYRERYVFTEIGYNLKPLELQCAMGRVQLKKLKKFKDMRRKNYSKLFEIFSQYPQFKLIENKVEGAESCWFGFPFLCREIAREKVMDYFESLNIETRTIFSGNILRHPAYKKTGEQIGKLTNCNMVMEKGMFISNHPSLTNEQIDFIGKAVKELVSNL